ncbi:hypothetical protein C2845_PM03G23740 [Panicum miliaceum]|uniref:Uncharacterized protein n=1 Tax=Panicum miliaceum TaxID=4540 RepID=A0A3L6TC27_PANMI|nr:hypothetical protein C2845_PM03G23740 [Panicum miliaceum]
MEARCQTTIYCPCLDCRNDKKYSDFEVVYARLIIREFVPNCTYWNKHREEGPNERGEWVADHEEGPNHWERQDGDHDEEEGNGQAYDDINEECILECNDEQFDALVDNVEDMIRDVRGEEDEMTEAEKQSGGNTVASGVLLGSGSINMQVIIALLGNRVEIKLLSQTEKGKTCQTTIKEIRTLFFCVHAPCY